MSWPTCSLPLCPFILLLCFALLCFALPQLPIPPVSISSPLLCFASYTRILAAAADCTGPAHRQRREPTSPSTADQLRSCSRPSSRWSVCLPAVCCLPVCTHQSICELFSAEQTAAHSAPLHCPAVCTYSASFQPQQHPQAQAQSSARHPLRCPPHALHSQHNTSSCLPHISAPADAHECAPTAPFDAVPL